MKFKKTEQTKPCSGCPFKKENTCDKSDPGGSHPFVYLGQARGPFWLPCHMDKNYNDANSTPDKVTQCRGAAIFRSNCGKDRILPKQLLDLPENKEIVFESESEFLKHYRKEYSKEVISSLTKSESLDEMMMREINKNSKTKKVYKT